MLTRKKQKIICSHLGNVKLQLLYKASIHGFSGSEFHQRCDHCSPTVSVGFNASGFVFGGYTKQPFRQSNQYAHDDEAFLFTFRGEKLVKYPVNKPEGAVKMMVNYGPYFGKDLILLDEGKPLAYNSPGNCYSFNAAQMNGNDLKLTECEVYQVEGKFSLISQTLMFSMFQKNVSETD